MLQREYLCTWNQIQLGEKKRKGVIIYWGGKKGPVFISITIFILEELCWLMVVCSGNPLWDYPVKEACFTGTPVVLAHNHTRHKSVGVHQSTLPFPLCLWVSFARQQRFMGGGNDTWFHYFPAWSWAAAQVYAAARLAGSPGRAFAPQCRLYEYVAWLFSTVHGSKIKMHIRPAHVEHEQKVMICTSVKW